MALKNDGSCRVPSHVKELLAGSALDLESIEGRNHLIETLLEQGDCEDIRWLFRQVDESDVAKWFETRAGRRLSRRSRGFWAWILAEPLPSPHPMTEQIWPL